MRIFVLGCGTVGNAIARDLAKDKYEVRVADISKTSLARVAKEKRIKGIVADLSKPGKVKNLVKNCDLAISAVPGWMGFRTLKTVIETGKNVVDISFFGEDPFKLDNLARKKGVTAIIDCGIAPGMSHVFLGHAPDLFEKVERYLCYVGGLPVARQAPFEYKATFSPSDIIEEYTRPARYVEGGRLVTKPALTGLEIVSLPGVGNLEAFNSDGMRTALRTTRVPFMKEKTLRYPGHAEKMLMLREIGLFSKEPVKVGAVTIRPLDLTSKLLFPKWKFQKGEEDFTVMRVIMEGLRGNRRLKYVYDMLDFYDRKNHISSVARTTGYTCSIAARLVAGGKFTRKGICPPEYLGRDKACYEALLEGLKARGINFKETVE